MNVALSTRRGISRYDLPFDTHPHVHGVADDGGRDARRLDAAAFLAAIVAARVRICAELHKAGPIRFRKNQVCVCSW